jgi:hypothetical protein
VHGLRHTALEEVAGEIRFDVRKVRNECLNETGCEGVDWLFSQGRDRPWSAARTVWVSCHNTDTHISVYFA